MKKGFFKKILVLLVVCAFANTNSNRANAQCNLTATLSKVNPTCYGDCNGNLTANPANGSGSYGYLWSNGSTTNPLSNQCAGTYTVTITDLVTQCHVTKSAAIAKGKVGATITKTPASCGLCNGVISVTGKGGNGGPYTYLWSNGATTSTITNACPNLNYAITVYDNLGCTFLCHAQVTNVGTVVSDNNPCTIDACDPVTGLPTYTPINTDDNNVCTIDGCDPVTGPYHTPVNTDDNNVCTTDGCDPVTGPYHTPINTDDNNLCTTDGCDPVTGVYHNPVNTNDNNVCTTDGCDPETGPYHTPVNTNDNNVCTTDGCDPVTGVYHNPVNTNDNNVCTTDGCDPVTGPYHTPINTNDNNVCTTDGCDPVTGPYHTPVNTNDNNVCTTDCCDPLTGPYHTPVNCNDNNACTTDGCDPVSGCYHTPISTPPTINCPGDAVVSGATGSSGPCVDLGGGGVATVSNPNPSGPQTKCGIDFRQPRNQGHPTDPLNWTNGVNNITQAEYFEGMGNPQRIILTGLAGTTHTLRFRHEAVKHQASDVHAYDFLMSWNQAIATAGTIGNGTLNELLNLNAQTCNSGISANALAACSSVSNTAIANIPDLMGNPPNHHGIANVNDVIACFEAIYGNRTIEMDGNAPITSFSIAFDGYDGTASGDNYAWYTISWTSASTNVMIKLAGRAAMGAGPCGYGACYGAGSIHGAPYHFKLELLDGASTGNRDNQLMVEENPTCDLTIPVTFGTATSTDGTITVVTSDSVTTSTGSVTHCRRWNATNSCNISSECTQCIQVVCPPARYAHGDTELNGAKLNVYPNPSNSKVNFDMVFDNDLENVSLELFNVEGQKVADSYKGSVVKGSQYHFVFDAANINEGVYFYHLNAGNMSKIGKVVILK